MIRTCTKCKTAKPVSEFRSRRNNTALESHCKICSYEAVKVWQQGNKDKVAAYRRKSIYGITDDEYNSMLDKQYESCAICDLYMDPPHIDHDHITGKVRALLCSNCNKALGLARDDIATLKAMINYLETHS